MVEPIVLKVGGYVAGERWMTTIYCGVIILKAMVTVTLNSRSIPFQQPL